MYVHCILLFTLFVYKVYSATINVDTSQAPDLATFGNQVKNTLTQWHPKISQLLASPNFEPPSNVYITFILNYTGVADSDMPGNKIRGNVQYYRSHQDDVGSMVHELCHTIQFYPQRSCPSWLIEGIADWVRYYNYEPNRKPSKPRSNQYYTEGYGVAAYFLQYILEVTNRPPSRGTMIYWANKDCRENQYNDNLWPRLTGRTLDEHWKNMQRDR